MFVGKVPAAVALLLVVAGSAGAQSRTVLDGVYSIEQARRGDTVYANTCSGCHGDVLQGKSDGPLRGQVFMDRWREDTLDTLFNHLQINMPARAPGSLSEATYLDLVAFILQTNGFPAGSELQRSQLAEILLVGKDGPKPLPTNATVKVVGCLAGGPEVFTLARAGRFARAIHGDSIADAELKTEATAALGTANLRLANMDDTRPGFQPGEWVGQKVFAKGVLTRLAAGDRIHVLAMAKLGACLP